LEGANTNASVATTRAQGAPLIDGQEVFVLRLFLSTGNIFLSLILGALMLAMVGYNSPETLSEMLSWARSLKGWITSTGLEPKYNIWLELLLEERQLLFMFFTIIARILLFIVTAPFSGVFSRR
jgi:hypothetical protein